jgi:isochorismate hydrolase
MVNGVFYLEMTDPQQYDDFDALMEDYWDDVEQVEMEQGTAYKAVDPDSDTTYLFKVTPSSYTEEPLDPDEADKPLQELLE